MIGTLARKRTNLVALAALLAMVAAMFALLAPVGAQTSPSTASVAVSFTDDTDGVIKAGGKVTVQAKVTFANLVGSPTGDVTAVTIGGAGNLVVAIDDTGSPTDLSDSPTTLTRTATVSAPGGTPAGDYVVNVSVSIVGFDSDGDGTADVDPKVVVGTKTLTIGDPGTNISSVSLSLARTRVRAFVAADTTVTPNIPEVPAIAKRHARTGESAGTSPETANESAGNNIFMSAAVMNSLGKSANSAGITGVSISAPGGSITVMTTPAAATETTADTSGTKTADSISLTGEAATNSTNFVVTKATAGTVEVAVTAIGADGIARSNTVTLTFAGPAATISLSDATETLLNQFKDRDTDGKEDDDKDTDGRDDIALKLTAADKAGNAVVPTDSATITIKDPKGVLVESNKIVVSQSVSGVTNTVTIRVADGVTAAKPLASGTYTVEARDGTKTDSAEFTVAGVTDSISLAADDMAPSMIGQTVTVTATLTDADGNAVADGTEVTFTATGSNAGVPVANRTGGTGVVKTKGGEAKALYVIATSGPGIISAVADGKSATVVLASTAGAAPAEEEEPEVVSLDCLSSNTGFSTYTCGVDSSASELFGLVSGRGASAIHLWNGTAWVRYSMVDGAMVPGSMNFTVQTNDILYISN